MRLLVGFGIESDSRSTIYLQQTFPDFLHTAAGNITELSGIPQNLKISKKKQGSRDCKFCTFRGAPSGLSRLGWPAHTRLSTMYVYSNTRSQPTTQVQRKAQHERSVERVHMERQVLVDARHPLVAPLYAAFQDRLYLYLEMEYCPGGSLDNFLRYILLCPPSNKGGCMHAMHRRREKGPR